MAYAFVHSNIARRRQIQRKQFRSLLYESLEARIPLDATQWLAVFEGLAHSESLEEQAQYGQNLLRSSGVSEQELQVVEALDLSGSFIVQTSTSVPEESVTAQLEVVPGFVFAQEYVLTEDPSSSGPPLKLNGFIDRDLYQDSLANESDYEAMVLAEQDGQIPDQSGTVEPDPFDALANNNAGNFGTSRYTQSETSLVAFGNTVVVGFNDSGSYATGPKFTGFARSTDGGATFVDGGTLPTHSIGDAGDPVLARNNSTGRIYFSTLGFNWPRTIQVFRSDNDGATWSSPVNGTPGGTTEDKQWITVDNFAGPGNGNVYLLSRRFAGSQGIYFFRSTDHGNSFGPFGGTLITPFSQGAYVTVGPDHTVYAFWWAGSTLRMRKSTNQGLSFSTPVTVASGLMSMFLTGQNNGEGFSRTIRTNSFPHVAVNPVSGHLYVTYANRGPGFDRGDVLMVQSTNGGVTWSAPVKINDDATINDQWLPTISVTPDGSKLGIFYYSRQEDTTTADGDPVNNQYKYYGRIGNISGSTVTFEPSFAVSDVPSKPEVGRDGVVNTTYMGDYDQAVATPGAFHVTWSDARSPLPGGGTRMDPNVYYARIPVGLSVTGSVPAAGSIVSTAPISITIDVAAPLDPNTLQPSDLSVNGIPASSVTYTPGSTTIVFSYASSPVTTEGSQSLAIAAGAFSSAEGDPVSAFNALFRYDSTPLQVASTIPPSTDGLFTLPGPFAYDVIFNEPIDPASLQTSDLVLSGMGGAFISGLTVLPGNTTARYTIGGVTNEGSITASIAAGAVVDQFGNPSLTDFTATYGIDIGTAAYVTPLEPKRPLGGLIYDPSVSGVINIVGDTDTFTLSIDPSQSITVVVEPVGVPTGSLAPTVEVRDPTGLLLDHASAIAGSKAFLQTVSTTVGGTYRIIVGGANTVGDYLLQVILNAAQEEEAAAASNGNDTRATAQNLERSFITLATPQANAERGAVLGQIGGLLSSVDFESGVLPINFTTGSFTSFGTPDQSGRIRVKTPDGTGNSSSYALMMDKVSVGGLTVNEAVMTVDLSNTSAPTLSFSHIRINDEAHFMPTSFTGHYPGDGVAISDDGVRWRTVLNAPFHSTWTDVSINLAAAASAAGMTLGPNFRIKFQQADDFPLPTDGRGYDNIRITTLDEDWYSFDLNAGDRATIAVDALSEGSLHATLVDSSGAVLTTGGADAANVDKIISNFAATATGTYYVRVSGTQDTRYSLVLLRNAAFDTERNDSQAQAQDISDVQGVLGSIDKGGPSQLYATGNNGSSLISIDQTTGVATTVGPLGYTHAFATAFTPDGKLWTIVNGYSSSASLASVDLVTGAATPVGGSTWTGSPLIALEADEEGNLYGGNWNRGFFSINKTTGQPTQLGLLSFTGLMDLTFDQNGTLWAVDGNNRLYRVNKATGASQFQSTITGVNGAVMGLMVNPEDNTFYATSWSSNSPLYRVDPNTGLATAVGPAIGVPFPHGGDFSPSGDTRSTVLNAVDSGWWTHLGSHNANNPNYIAGRENGLEFNNFFVFNLAGINEPIASATLVATNGLASRGPGYRSPDPSETYTLFDVSTPISALTTSGNGQTTIFDDLGTGISYGSRDITAADNSRPVPIALNDAGIAALNAALGSQVALGGAVTTLARQARFEQVFAFTGNPRDTKQLVLQFGSPADWYSIDIASVDYALRLETSTPADGPGEFVNTLNPRIELYDPSGTLVASGVATADGRNEVIQYTPLSTGKYRVRVTGDGNSRGEYFLSKNLSPVVSSIAANSPISENGFVTVTGTISDPDERDSHTVTIDWGPDNGQTTLTLAAGVTTFSASHQYLDDNPTGTSSDDYTITVSVTDNHGASGGLATVSPTVITELVTNGGFETGDFTGWTVVNSGTRSLWAINNGTFDPEGPGTPLAPISGTFDAVAAQGGPSTQILSEPITVPANVTAATLSWSDRIRNYANTFSDPNQEWRVLLRGATGNVIQEIYSTKPGDAPQQLGPNHRSFDLTAVLKSLSGQTIHLSFEVQDNLFYFNTTLDNVSLLVTTPPAVPAPQLPVVTVNNVPPSDVVLNDGTVDENGTFTLTGSFIDPGTEDTHRVVIDWGDGQQPTTVELPAGATTFSASHQYLDDGDSPGNGTASDTYAVLVSVIDDDQGAAPPATAQASVTVNNVAPHSVAIDPDVQTYVFAVGAPQTFTGLFSDVGTLDRHTATWTFQHVIGLSSVVETRPATVTQSSGSGSVSDSFVFDNDATNQDGPGVYTVTLTVTDDDTGTTTSASRTFVVYDPSEGFVSGGGWIDSPAGAYAADPALSGRANFGFNSRYHSDQTIPKGQAEFKFNIADLNFHSESYDWLVVAGARAQYSGTGTLGGTGHYGFMLTVIDGQASGGGGVDRFRMKIWNMDDTGAVVYDNGLGAEDDAVPASELRGGSIVVHTQGRALRSDGAPAASSGTMLTSDLLRPAVSEAISAWAMAGVDAAQLTALSRVDVQLANLSGGLLGMASEANLLWIDVDAAGYGWGIGSASGGMHLTSVLAHELGHILGLDDLEDHDHVMGSHLSVGIQRMPSLGSVASLSWSSLAGSTLPSDALFDQSLRFDMRRWLAFEDEREEESTFSDRSDLVADGVATLDRASMKYWDSAILLSLTDADDDEEEGQASHVDAALKDLAEEFERVK